MLDAQTLQWPPDLRRSRAINFAARRRRVKIMRAPVRIKAHGKAMRAKHRVVQKWPVLGNTDNRDPAAR